jgi:hypothetical protein
MLAAEILIGLGIVKCFRRRIQPQLLASAPSDVARMAHECTDVAGIDLLVQRFALPASYRVEEIAGVGFLRVTGSGYFVPA